MEMAIGPQSFGHISLKELLELQNQPVSEEQAWALCYQLCLVLDLGHSDETLQNFCSKKVFQLPRADGILYSSDGRISIKINSGDHHVFETEDQAIDYLGRLIYSCLDWGLETNVERDLDESLELLVCQMVHLNTSQNGESNSPQRIYSVSEVMQICEDRLYDPANASQHYRGVCAALFSETVELCENLRSIQQTRESLQKLIMESETRLMADASPNWMYAWKVLVEEVSMVELRPSAVRGERLNKAAPPPEKLPAFKQLLQDIQLRRYTLRKIQSVGTDARGISLDFTLSLPKLRPVSERKLNVKPKEEPCLHERLMQEIRMTSQLKPLRPCQRRTANQKQSKDNCLQDIFEDPSEEDAMFLMNPFLGLNLHEVLSDERQSEDSLVPPDASLTADQELKFFPVLASSPVNPNINNCRRKRRTRSFASNKDLCKLQKTGRKACVPMTIADVSKGSQTKGDDLRPVSRNRCRSWRVCSFCSKMSLYFTWHNICSLCNRVVCPDCCVQMRIPFKWYVHLPISFFKTIVLNNQDRCHFWNERWSWDCSRVPLVLDSGLPSSHAPHSLAMRGWHSQDVCVGCQRVLQEACDTVFFQSASSGPQEI